MSHASTFKAPDIETASEDYARRFSGEVGDYFLAVQSAIVLKLLEPVRNPTILDVGGGHAQLAVPLVNNGYSVTVTGSDPSCRRRLDERLPAGSFRFELSTMSRLPFPDAAFDVDMAFRLITHLEDWKTLLAEMCRVSRQAVIMDYPDARSVNFFADSLFGTKKAVEGNTRPFRLFRRRQVIEALRSRGFGDVALRPQFFMPMVVHRMLGSLMFTKSIEAICRSLGLTHLFGSPVILKSVRLDEKRA